MYSVFTKSMFIHHSLRFPGGGGGGIFEIGLLKTLSPTRTSTIFTISSLPGYVHSILPTFHYRLAVFRSITMTTSPTLRFTAGENHLRREPICVKYSFIHRRHTYRINSCTRLQRLRGLNAVVSPLSGMKSPPICPISILFVEPLAQLGSVLAFDGERHQIHQTFNPNKRCLQLFTVDIGFFKDAGDGPFC